jgi:hypothetical protein
MSVTRDPPKVGRPDRVRLTGKPELPARLLAGGRGHGALVAELIVRPLDGTAVGDYAAAADRAAEEIREVRGIPLSPRGPGQRERLPGDPGYPGVPVGLDDVMPLQPGLIQDMRSGGRRPPPAREVALPPVRGGLAQRLRQAEVNEVGIVQVHSVLPPAIVGVHEQDPGRQLARDNRRVMGAFRYC